MGCPFCFGHDARVSRLDPAAVAFHAVVLAVVAVLCVTLFLMLRSDPAPAPAKGGGVQGAVESVKKMIGGTAQQAKRSDPPPKAAPLPQKVQQQKAASSPPAPGVPALPPGRSWRYSVTLEPPQWRDAQLVYRTAEMSGGTAVYTEFTHAAGKMNFQLGTFSANHPSHANVRFPGFFMHAAYLDRPLEVGQRFSWEWPWQLAGGATRSGRVKRYAGHVAAWEEIAVPAGRFPAARIETTLSYVEDGRVRASARETLWYAPQAGQVVKVVRDGATPDDGASRIVAELVALQ